jgi:hypothetical protein
MSRRYGQIGGMVRVACDSAGTQTGQTRIVSCDRLVSTTIYAIWGLPINELYTSGPAFHRSDIRPRQILA